MSIMDDLMEGRIKLYEIERHVPVDEAVRIRREFIERTCGVKLEHVSNYSIDMERASRRNIENPIGVVQIPLGVAGPLRVRGEHADGEYYVPLATSEGALVASVNRGCSVITRAGGATVRVTGDSMTRAPVIRTGSVVEALQLREWIYENMDALREEAESTTRHGKLVKIDPIIVAGSYVYPRFVYTTGDSMGMNMVTIATERALELLTRETGAHVIALSGNLCTDKKPAAVNLIEGRGKSITAEITVPGEMVESVLKTTPEAVVEVNTAKNLIGSAAAGSMGFNAHYANIIGAIFLATGQDEAHIVEGSLGVTIAEERKGDLYFAVNLPDVPLATVGGGTGLETASECLDIMGVRGGGRVHAFAEIVGGAVLAGELSLMGALAAGHLARAHSELGRG
ncbi:hydroxymethylglutaryl-CoA reductase (NADPH) [Methanothermobacter thermautotrophicus]|uniref:3-hydroxy-3-methylglutaryl-coenzyme A reductase n=2 Tax=Methanothermobacter thermautotrophicus TaxID=145262 RepID=HMDH_METTH|nr:hydroxymethylglutaryl-CoA reductase (NADPH) [Methanothermobacter thermautotrophicus]O26662.1 RecName: Full=3-hydroxy-3-methylglutaryl-coenzyme A reductase; Short=HMG-CoA reductase [Methanothermobacter thermautotrophicus str. Delta H]AAB85068.1 3-hydroxy-3-methylglutaryl CoA reductase [Methanothermobacter thermautotrophicus str. Delta H]WBF06817.1 hydroxymethylglutaryl-CoA reductase (NADPH) [Methanothermobacter thermautotrophicus]WBF08612.1 hydroxymethylglutaryl-CoA reductase (NADPH) [Methano